MFNVFILNLAMIIAIVYLGMRIKDYMVAKKSKMLFFMWISTALGICLSLLIIANPFKYGDMIFDLRVVPIFVISYLFGWRYGLISAIIPILYRASLGGASAIHAVILTLILPVIIGGLFGVNGKDNLNDTVDIRRIFKVFMLLNLIKLSLILLTADIPFMVWLEISFNDLTFSTLSVLSVVLIINDTNRMQQAQERIKESEEKYRYLVDVSPEAIVIYQNEKIMFANAAVEKLVGANSSAEIIGKSVFDFLPRNFWTTASQQTKKFLNNNLVNFYEYKLKKLSGEEIDVEATGKKITYQNEQMILVMIKDVSERKKLDEQIKYMAFHDSLTNLPNRNMLNDSLEKAIYQAKKNGQTMGIIFLDLDRFKLINDTFGHEFGDLVLKQIAKRLSSCTRKQDLLIRHGGDEFIILMKNTNRKSVKVIAEKIVKEFAEPLDISDREIFSSASLGIAMYPFDGSDAKTLITKADKAMYQAKESGRNNYKFYQSDFTEILSKRMNLEVSLRNALKKEEFVLYYQPQIDLNTNQITGMEALLRWNHPEYGLIYPNEFIDIAEETGMIIPIGDWVIKTACYQLKQWHEVGVEHLTMAVNIAYQQIEDQFFIERVVNILKEIEMEPGFLELELTEHTFGNSEESIFNLKKLKEIGFRISIDDFGVGYSILNVLKHVPFDKLKIDQTFIRDALENPNTAIIVKAFIQMGQRMNFNIGAEGIENEQQLSFLKEHNCNSGQGYLFSYPLPAKEISNQLLKNAVNNHL